MSDLNSPTSAIYTHDNLPVLRGLNSRCVDLIYLDPPFNTGREWHNPIGEGGGKVGFSDIWGWDRVTGETLEETIARQWEEERDYAGTAVREIVEAAVTAHSPQMGSYCAWMAPRLIELHRVLKDTGSIYLHCDPASGHYLKALMDAVFGRQNFRNEIAWRRVLGGKSDPGQYGRSTDRILFYSRSDSIIFTPPRLSSVNDGWYRNPDEDVRGPYVKRPLLAHGPRTGDSGQEWRGMKPTGHWIVPNLLAARYESEMGSPLAGTVRERLEALATAGYIEFNRSGKPSWRRYLSEANPPRVDDLWADDKVKPIPRRSKERMGYPTQKPVALLERIIAASSAGGGSC